MKTHFFVAWLDIPSHLTLPYLTLPYPGTRLLGYWYPCLPLLFFLSEDQTSPISLLLLRRPWGMQEGHGKIDGLMMEKGAEGQMADICVFVGYSSTLFGGFHTLPCEIDEQSNRMRLSHVMLMMGYTSFPVSYLSILSKLIFSSTLLIHYNITELMPRQNNRYRS